MFEEVDELILLEGSSGWLVVMASRQIGKR